MALKLDIGCGGRGIRWGGFVGIDILPRPESVPPERWVQLDFVRDALPWADGTVDEIVALHVIEHLDRPDGRKLILRAMGLLKVGALLTVTCLDLRLISERYLARDRALFDTRHTCGDHPIRWPGATLADKLNWVIHEYGHRWAYDQESLRVLAVEAGCIDVSPISEGSPYFTKPDHETGIVIRRTGREDLAPHLSAASVELERRIAMWRKREETS